MKITRFVFNSVTVLATLAVTTAFSQTFYSKTLTNDRPLVYWNFDEGGGDAVQQMTVPASPTPDNDLIPFNTATRISHAAAGSGLFLGEAADLDGSGNFSTATPNFGVTSLNGPYAIELWMQVKPQAAGNRNDYVISFDNNGRQGVAYDWAPNVLQLYSEFGGVADISVNDQDTNWHHVVWVFYGPLRASGKVDVYLDGVRMANISPYSYLLSLNQQFTVGDYATFGGLGFNGRLDEVAIYDWTTYTNSAALLLAKANALVNDHQQAKSVSGAGVSLEITAQPADATGVVGQTTNFTVAATASGPITYQWQKNWVDIPNATNATYSTPTIAVGDAGTIYRVRVGTSNVFTFSREARLGTELLITFAPQPTNVFTTIGNTATFFVGATSTPPATLSYQWRKNGALLPNATNASYTTPTLLLADVGTNLFQVRVNAGVIFQDSNEAMLVVAPPPMPNTAYSQIVTNDGPLLYWNFDEVSGPAIQQIPVFASPTTVNDFVPVDGASRVDHAAIGSNLPLGFAADFNGANNFFVDFPNANGLLTLSGAYAIEYWIQHQETAGPTNNNDFLMSFRSDGSLAVIYDWESNDHHELYGGSETTRTLTNGPVVASLTDTSWHHIVWVYYGLLRTNETQRLDAYRDGVRMANIESGYNSELSLLGPITLGEYRPAGGLGFIGRMDEVAIYDFSSFGDEGALTTHVNELVARHYAAAAPPTLSFARTNNQLTLSWSGTGFRLETAGTLTSPVWTNVVGGTNSPVTVNTGSGNRFYRLAKP